MRIQNFLIILLIVSILLGVGTYFVMDHIVPKEVTYIEFDFETVKSGAGFNLDKDKFHFGSIPLKGYARREINIINNDSFRERVVFLVGSNVSLGGWVKFTPNSGFILNPGASQTFQIKIFPPENATLQKYEGMFAVKIYKAWPGESYTEELDLENTIFTSNGFRVLWT